MINYRSSQPYALVFDRELAMTVSRRRKLLLGELTGSHNRDSPMGH